MPGIISFRRVGGDSSEVSEGKTYTRRFQAWTEPRTEPHDVQNDSLCPQYLSRDSRQPRGWVKRVRVDRDAKVIRLFHVEVEYSNSRVEENPLDRPANISWKEAFRQIPIIRDLDGKPILNKAGDFIEGVMVDESYWIASVEKNIPPGPATWLQSYSNTVNEDRIRIDGLRFDKGVLLCRGLNIGHPTTENGYGFRTARFELWQNEHKWQLDLWNRGLYERAQERVPDQRPQAVSATNPAPQNPPLITVEVKKRIVDDRNEPVNEAQFLDEHGRAYRVASDDGTKRLKHPLDPEDLISLNFTIRGEKPFRNLPLE